MNPFRSQNSCRWLVLAASLAAAGAPCPVLAQVHDIGEPAQLGLASRWLVSVGLDIAPLTAPADFSARRAVAWDEGDVQRLDLADWVQINIGPYDLRAQRAAVWIHRRPDGDATRSNIVLYLEGVSAVNRPSGEVGRGERLLVTAATTGPVRLSSDSFIPGPPVANEFLQRAEGQAIDLFVRESGRPVGSVVRPIVPPPRPPLIDPSLLSDGQAPPDRTPPDRPDADDLARLTPPEPPAPPQTGVYRPPAVLVLPLDQLAEFRLSDGEEEGVATFQGRLVAMYRESDPRPGEREPRHLTMQADRMVVFTDPITQEQLLTGQLDPDAIRGVYLEGDVVVSDGRYTVRGPRVFYDLTKSQAVVLDAVLSTHDPETGTPVYVRAEEVRRLSEDQWRATNVRLSTSEFHTPLLSIGADEITLTQIETESGASREYIDARDITLRLGNVPFFWWPRYRGDVDSPPLRRVSFGGNEQDGFVVSTEWDLFGLVGQNRPDDFDAGLLVEYYSNRGPATGIDLTWDDAESHGGLFGFIIHDEGTDKIGAGREFSNDNDTRGIVDLEHFERLPDDWTLIVEGSYISDERFVEAFFPREAGTRREYASRLYARQQRDNWQFEAQARYDFNEFIPNEDLFQSRTYITEKLPEIGYYRFADAWFDGRVSYSSEYRLSRMSLSFPDHTIFDVGQGRRLFDLPPATYLPDYLESLGLSEDPVHRFYTRHEFSVPMQWGILDVTPFVSGAFVAYDDDFDEFSREAEDMRALGGAGVRIATQFSRTNNDLDNRLFDLHRVRHIIEPSLTLWHGESNADSDDYPIYDQDVEGMSKGSAMRLGLRNVWQTQRGGPGRWYSVDVFTLDTDLILHSHEIEEDSAIPFFYEYRPEYSRFGDHFLVDGTWLVSDTLALAGYMNYRLDTDEVAHSSVGYRLDHTPAFYTFADWRYFEPFDDSLLGLGLGYTISPLYEISGVMNYDLNESEARNLNAVLLRHTTQLDVALGVSYNAVRDEATVSLTFVPLGAREQRFRSFLNPPERR